VQSQIEMAIRQVKERAASVSFVSVELEGDDVSAEVKVHLGWGRRAYEEPVLRLGVDGYLPDGTKGAELGRDLALQLAAELNLPESSGAQTIWRTPAFVFTIEAPSGGHGVEQLIEACLDSWVPYTRVRSLSGDARLLLAGEPVPGNQEDWLALIEYAGEHPDDPRFVLTPSTFQ
jgi:hypothetical protein